nr:YdcF family protein [uncultured Roseateles sp.]
MNLTQLYPELKPFLVAVLLPPGPFLLLSLVGAALLRRHRGWGRIVLGLGTLGIWLSCTEGFAQFLAETLVHPTPALSAETLQTLQVASRDGEKIAVLVLGGGARNLVPEYQGPALKLVSEERLRYGVWLARQVDAPLGFSGGIGWGARHLSISEASAAKASAQNTYKLPLRWAEGQSRDTHENAQLSMAMLKADGIQTVVLVTHDLHMPRAMRAFSQAKPSQMRLVAAPVGYRRDGPFDWQDWSPSEEGLPRVRYTIYEWLAQLSGR